MNSKSKKKRVALIGSVTNKKKNANGDDIVSEIIRTMDAKNSKFSNKKVEAYQSMLEYQVCSKDNGGRVKTNSLEENVIYQPQSKPLIQSKKIFHPKKPPLMAKCERNLKYLKHNRAIPKQRAHVGTLDMAPKSVVSKTQVGKRRTETLLNNSRKKNNIKGNIWMVNELNNRTLESSGESDMEDISQDSIEPSITENMNSTDSDSDFESFVKSHKETMPDVGVSSKNPPEKRKKTQCKKSIISTKRVPKNFRLSSNELDMPRLSTSDDNDSSDGNQNKILRKIGTDVQSELSETEENLVEDNTVSEQKFDCVNQITKTSSINNERIGLKFFDCSVKLLRDPAIDTLVSSNSCDQNGIALNNNENNSESFANNTVTRKAEGKKYDDDDDCMIIDVVQISKNNQESKNKLDCSNSSDKPLLSVNDKLPIGSSIELCETLPNVNCHRSSEIEKDLGIQILSVASLEKSSDINLSALDNIKEPKETVVQNVKGHLNCLNNITSCEDNEPINTSCSESRSVNKGTHKSYPKSLPDNLSLEENNEFLVKTPQVMVDELLSKLDIEAIKKVVKIPSEESTGNSCNYNSLSHNENLSSVIARESENSTSNTFSEEMFFDRVFTQLQNISDIYTMQKSDNVQNTHNLANSINFETLELEDIKKILAISKSASQLTSSSHHEKNQSPERFKLNEDKVGLSMNNPLGNDLFWDNLKKAISANSNDSNTESIFNTKLSEMAANIHSQLSDNVIHQSSSSSFVTNYSIPNENVPLNIADFQIPKSNSINQSDFIENKIKNIAKHNYDGNPSDELDVIAATSIQNLCHDPQQYSILSLFKLYARALSAFKIVKSAGQDAPVGLKMLEKDLGKNVKMVEQAIESYCRYDPCFYKVMVDRNFVKSESPHCTVDEENARSERKTSLHQKPPCYECGKTAVIKCLGCSKVFFCSENCGMTYWNKIHHLHCEKNFPQTP